MKRISLIFAAAASLLVSACGNPNQVTLPVTRSFDCDVLVIGGGPAGIGAAVCAARHGASTILAERSGYLGGMATNGLVAPFMSSTTPDGNTLLIRGFYEELVDRMVEQGGAIHPLKAEIGSFSAYRDKGHHGLTTFDFECLKRTTEQMCKEAGVKLLYHTLFIKADTKGGKITAAYFATKDGIWKVTAKEYIDNAREKLSFLDRVPIFTISALTGQRTHKILDIVKKLYTTSSTRIPTGELNRVFRRILAQHTPPTVGSRNLKFYFAQQVAIRTSSRARGLRFSNTMKKGARVSRRMIQLISI